MFINCYGNGEEIKKILITMKTFKALHRIGIVLSGCMFVSLQLIGQIKFQGMNNKSMEVSINGLYQFLKDTPTDIHMPEKDLQPFKAPLYDKAIDSFFDRAAMSAKLGSRQVDVRTQYQVMFGIDKNIDQIPADSIFAMPAGYFYEKYWDEKLEGRQDWNESYVIGFLVSDKYYPVLDLGMTGSGKIAYIMPYIYFDLEKQKVMAEFTSRHKKQS